MRKPVVIVAAALIAISALSPSSAQAGDGGAIAAGVIGGLAVGALAGAAVANSHRAPVYVYDEHTYVPVYRSPRRVHVHRYYEAPYYSDYGYSSGYSDGYRDAAWDW
jgi:hypothetical protein